MPWKIDENNCVIRADTGKEMHCYPKTPEGKADAEAYLKALYANAPEAKKSIVVHKHCSGCGKSHYKALGGGDFPGNMPPQMAAGLCKKFGGDPGFFTRCEASDLKLPAGYDKKAYCAELHKHCVGKWPTEGEHPKREGKELPTNWVDKLIREAKQKKIIIRFKYHPSWPKAS